MSKKKLIEVALPLEAINKASAREKSIRHGHPSTLHLWWARRPLAAARAVIFAQMVDDPSSYPDLFKTEKAQEKERQRLFKIIEDLVQWENTNNEEVLKKAREEIWQSWRRACAENADHPRAKELFDRNKLPTFHDPFAGGGSLPLEAQRFGLEAYASDLNPVAVLINKAMIEIPSRFANRPPVNPEWQKKSKEQKALRTWKGAQGLADDVRFYGQWMREEAERRIGHLYPKIEITPEMAKDRPDLKPYVGKSLTAIAWLWARTVKSPNPAFRHIDVPLVSTFMLSTKTGKEAYIEPIIENDGYKFLVRLGKPRDVKWVERGTKAGGSGTSFVCLISSISIPFEYIREEAKASRMGARLMAIVAEGKHGRVYLSPLPNHEMAARKIKPDWMPETTLPKRALGFRVQEYGMINWADLFTSRQLVALKTFSELVRESIDCIKDDIKSTNLPKNEKNLGEDSVDHIGYPEAITTYLGFAVDKGANYWSSLCSWHNDRETVTSTFGRQTLPMVWDFVEANPFSESSGNILAGIDQAKKVLDNSFSEISGVAIQADAATQCLSSDKVISTDPPYYHYIGYSDLSDFFYIWLRYSLKDVFPKLFSTLTVPKAEELVANPYRHGNRNRAETFFLDGMTRAMKRLAGQSHPAFPVTIYYAFKQSESKCETGKSSTGWETFLNAVIEAGFEITGTWPIRTEYTGNLKKKIGVLASSIVLVCKPHTPNSIITTRREFISILKRELPHALINLERSNIAPVDFAQAAIGPGMAIFCRYAKVMESDGMAMSVGAALQLINQELDSFLARQEEEMDPDTRFCLTWFEQYGLKEEPFGDADVLARAKNTSVQAMADDGIIISKAGKVRLIARDELSDDWEPEKDKRLTIWECTQHLVRRLSVSGEDAAAQLVARLGGARSEEARALAYRLYSICDRKKWAQEALEYNSLVIDWPEITRMAMSMEKKDEQGRLF